MRIGDEERRRRLVARHHHARTATDVVDAVRGVTAQHSSDPLTPHLGARARVPDFTTGDLDEQLSGRRSLWRLHAMRRTLFVVPVDAAPAVLAGATRDVARKERRRLVRMLEAEMPPDRVGSWLAGAEAAVLDALGSEERSTTELTDRIPDLQQEVTLGSGRWASRSRVGSRVLFLLAMDGRVVRTRPAGTWRSSQYRWATVDAWFGPDVRDALVRVDEDEARVALARDYLARHGPASVTDLRWWTGWTKTATTRALQELDTATVDLDGDEAGVVLADDREVGGPAPSPTAALLPSLDSSAMGWKQRAWYLGTLEPEVYDRAGNAGPTVWVDGQVVGGWAQRPDGRVVHELVPGVATAAREAVDAEADDLAAWLDGTVVTPRFPSPLHRRLSG